MTTTPETPWEISPLHTEAVGDIPIFVQAVPWDRARAINAVKNARSVGATLVWDKERSGFKTWKDVLREVGDSPAVIFEDDVELCPNWRERTTKAIEEYPNHIIRFFADTERDRKMGKPYFMEGKHFGSTVCNYYPPGYAHEILVKFYRDRDSKHLNAYYDLEIARWLKGRKEDFVQYYPSLIQHMPWKSVVNPNRRTDRISHNLDWKSSS